MAHFSTFSHRIGQASLLAVLAAALAAAQQPDPTATQTAPPPPAVFQNQIPASELSFLAAYDGKMPGELERDKRFRQLEKMITPPAYYFYHRDKELSEARDEVLDESPLPISVRDNRFVMVASSGGPDAHMSGRGFIWIDMQTGIGLGGIYFKPSNGEPTPTLAIFSRQLTDTDLGMSQLPPEFLDDLDQWALLAKVNPTAPRYFIPANKKKYVLVHDLDFCAHAAGVPAPHAIDCQELNAEAADSDLEAAYFMKQTDHLSDATAFLLDPSFNAWIAFRERTCGNGLECRIVYTRRRTRELLAR